MISSQKVIKLIKHRKTSIIFAKTILTLLQHYFNKVKNKMIFVHPTTDKNYTSNPFPSDCQI